MDAKNSYMHYLYYTNSNYVVGITDNVYGNITVFLVYHNTINNFYFIDQIF